MADNQTVAVFITQSQAFYDRCHEFYKPLDPDRQQIRLMNILPAPFEDESIHLTLSHVDLADEPYYETVSYTWEAMTPTKQVFIHGLAYNVTVNQYAALRRLRSDKPRPMWMDVICIDQANVAERGHQVSVMGAVFSNAARTHVWIGELDETWYTPISDEVWEAQTTEFWDDRDRQNWLEISTSPVRDELMKKYPSDIVKVAGFVLELLASDMHWSDMPYCTITGEQVKFNRSWYDASGLLISLLERPWWNRVWVLQEILLCKDDPIVMFGPHQLPFKAFMKATEYTIKHFVTAKCCLSVAGEVFTDHNLPEKLMSFLHLNIVNQSEPAGQMTIQRAALLTDGKNATDTRDFVYGVLSLMRPEDRISVDYTLSTEQVFALASWHHFRAYGGFLWLERAGSRSPSWSIDWVDTDRLGFRLNWTFAMDDTEVPDWDRTRLSGQSLELPANQVAEVRLVFENKRDPDVCLGHYHFNLVTHWLDRLEEAGLNGNNLKQAAEEDTDWDFWFDFFVTSFRNTKFDMVKQEPRRLEDDDLAEIAYWWSALQTLVANDAEDRYPTERMLWACTAFGNYTKDCALALTQENKICLVPNGTQIGDQIYHVRACNPVMVLREIEENEFRLIGSGYLAEAMGSSGWKPTEEKVIKLS